jgi:transposase-like protein
MDIERQWRKTLKAIYSAPTAEAAEQELNHFGEKWGQTHRAIEALWRRNWGTA